MKKFLVVLLVSITNFQGFAQSNDNDSLIDELLYGEDADFSEIKKKTNYHFIYTGLNFSNRTFSLGQEIGDGMNNYSGQIYYFNSNGFMAGIAGIGYSDFDPKYSTTILTTGYSKKHKDIEWLNLRASGNYYLYNFGDYDFDPTFRGSINLGLTAQKKFIGTRLDLNTFVGSEVESAISWDVFSRITLKKWPLKGSIQIRPEVSTYFASGTMDMDDAVSFYEFMGWDVSSFEKFGLLNTRINLPLRVSYKSIDFGIGYELNFPNSKFSDISTGKNHGLSFSVGYLFNVGR